MTARLLWRTTAADPHVHGWTGEREFGWPYATCGYSCPQQEIAPGDDGMLCPTCVRYAREAGEPIPPADVCPHTRVDFWHWLRADWQRVVRACLLMASPVVGVLIGVLVVVLRP